MCRCRIWECARVRVPYGVSDLCEAGVAGGAVAAEDPVLGDGGTGCVPGDDDVAGVRVDGGGYAGGSVRPVRLGVGDGAPSQEGCGQDGQGQECGSQGHGAGIDGCHIGSTPSCCWRSRCWPSGCRRRFGFSAPWSEWSGPGGHSPGPYFTTWGLRICWCSRRWCCPMTGLCRSHSTQFALENLVKMRPASG